MIDGFIFDNKKTLIQKSISTKKAKELIKSKKHSWINITNFKNEELDLLKGVFPNYFPLIREDITESGRPKIERFENFISMIFKGYKKDNSIKEFQLNVILGKDFIITLQKGNELNTEKIQQYFSNKKSTADFVLYKILEELFEEYYNLLEVVDDKIALFEKRSLKNPQPKVLQGIMELKRKMISVHRTLAHEREIMVMLSKGELNFIKPQTRAFMRDIYDDVIHLLDTEESLKENLSTNVEIYLSSLSNSTNEVMKVLTLVASFAMVPTLIAGIYGMNFKYIPEIHGLGPMGYPLALGLMLTSTMIMFAWFKRKGWL